MADPTGFTSLVPLLTSYHDYFAMAEMNTFRGRYAVVLIPYKIEMVNADASVKPQELAHKIYDVDEEGVLTVILQ